MKQLIRSRKIWVDHRNWLDGAVECEGGKVLALHHSAQMPALPTIDIGLNHLIPGLVDTHVHINEPGRTEWEGFSSATQAAAAGGITTLVDMPLNCIPVTTTLLAVGEKLHALAGKLTVDCALHGGVVPGNVGEIAPMVDAGIRTFKAFMIDSGIDEFPAVNFEQLRIAMSEMARCGATLLAHAEVDCIDPRASLDLDKNPASYAAYLRSRPRQMEDEAIRQLIELSKLTRCRVHVVHLSSASALSDIRKAKAEGVAITCETCPHYLLLSAESIADGDGRFKCAPPIRDAANRSELWSGLADGTIDFVVSDHSPCTPQLKLLHEKNLKDAWGGISSLQFGLSLIWTEASRRGFTLDQVIGWMCNEPAKLVRLNARKGRISVGMDADFVAFDPEADVQLLKSTTLHRHKDSPYENWRGKGKVHATWLRGSKIYEDNTFPILPIGERL